MPFDDKNISSCLDASYRQTKLKSVLCVPGTELEMEGGRDTATLKLLFGLCLLLVLELLGETQNVQSIF